MGALISKLIRDGDVAGLWSAKYGDWVDLSGNGNKGVMSAGCQWSGFGMRFPANTDEVTIPDDPTLRLTTGSIVAAVDIQSMTATEYVVAHDNAGSGFSLGINATSLVFTGDGVARTIVTSLYGTQGIGATFVHGGTPIGYVNGLSVGNFSGVVNVTAAAVVTEIGNWANSGRCKSTGNSFLVCNRILTATEMAAAHAELLELGYPTSQWGSAKIEQDVFKEAPGIVAGWDMRPVSGVIPDQVGANDGTIVGCPMYAPGILGDAMRFNGVDDYIDCGNDASLVSQTDVTVMGWGSRASAGQKWLFNCFAAVSDAWGVVTSGNIYISDDIDNAGASIYITAIPADRRFHYAAVMDGLENKL